MKRGQAAMEMIFIIALVLVVTIPFLAGSMSNLNKKVSIENKVQKANEIAHGIETLSNLGPGNSMTVVTSDGFQIINNVLYYGEPVKSEQVSVKILPKVKDMIVDEGEIKIVNDANEGIVVAEAPILDSINPLAILQGGAIVTFYGDNFKINSKVYFDDRPAGSIVYISENEIKSGISPTAYMFGYYPVYVENSFGDEVYISNSLNIFVGGSPSL